MCFSSQATSYEENKPDYAPEDMSDHFSFGVKNADDEDDEEDEITSTTSTNN